MTANLRLLAIVSVAAALAACGFVGDYSYMKEGQPHAEEIVSAVSQGWDADKLIEAEDPRMLAIAPAAKTRDMIAQIARQLGVVRSQKTIMGETGIETGISGEVATYLIELDAEKGTGRITIKLQKVADRWMVLGFWVRMKTLSPEGAVATDSVESATQPSAQTGPQAANVADAVNPASNPASTVAASAVAIPVQPVSPPATPQVAPPASFADVSDADLLSKAKIAQADQQLFAPAGNNAIEYYLALRQRLPNDESTRTALIDLFPYAVIATQRSLTQGDEPGRLEAARIFALLERMDPNAPQVSLLRTRMQAAGVQPRVEPDTSGAVNSSAGMNGPSPAQSGASESDVERMLDQADGYRKYGTTSQIDVGRNLINPPGSNAVELYQKVLAAQPGNQRARQGLQDVATFYAGFAQKTCDKGMFVVCRQNAQDGLRADPDNATLKKLVQLAEDPPRGNAPGY